MHEDITIALVEKLASRATSLRRPRQALVWRMVAVSGLVIGVSMAVYPILPRVYTGTASIQLRATNQEGATTWDHSVRDALDDNVIGTKINIMKSTPLLKSVIDKTNLLSDAEFNPALRISSVSRMLHSLWWLAPWLPEKRGEMEQVEATLLKRLIIARGAKSYTMQIAVESADPAKSAQLTNSLVDDFLAEEIGRKVESHNEILASLADRVKSLEGLYNQAETAENNFVMSSGLIHASERVAMEHEVEGLSAALAEAHRRSAETTSKAIMLGSQHGDLDSTSEALNSPLLQRLRERLVELSSGAGSGNVPSGVSQMVLNNLQDRIETETRHLLKAAQNDAVVAIQTETSLGNEIHHIDEKLVQWRINERHRADLHRAVQVSLDAWTGANARYMQEAGRGDVLQGDIEVVSRASIPDRPSFPNPTLYVIGTFAMIVLLCGVMLVPSMWVPRHDR
jgi:succinoglycan biosynthesis transport protein ExoP